MRLPRVLVPVVPVLVLTGCAYIHFGRLPPASMGDRALQQAYSDLSLEQKILKQELVLARRENDTLREALDHSAGDASASVTQLTHQLEATSRELATVRAGYAKLQAERTAAPNIVSSATSAELASLKDENTRLRGNLATARQENAAMAEKLKAAVTENLRSQSSIAQLTADLRAQKQARDRAENVTAALHTQLEAVMARAGRAEPAEQAPSMATRLGDLETSRSAGVSSPPAANRLDRSASSTESTADVSSLHRTKAPPSDAAPTAEFHTSLSRIRAAAEGAAATAGSIASTAGETPVASPPSPTAAGTEPPRNTAPVAPAPAPASNPSPASVAAAPSTAVAASVARQPQTYTVKSGDTLEKLATRFYGAADQWPKIYSANSDLLSASQGLKPGMQLVIPEK